MGKYIRQLIAQGEHQHLDFKFVISDARKIARTLSAFANTGGGKLLIGVKDNGIISGVQTDEEAYMIESAADVYCKPPVPYELETWTVDGKQVLEVSVSESPEKPHLAPWKEDQWRAFVRVADENFVANNVQVAVWKKLRAGTPTLVQYSEIEERILEYLERNEQAGFAEIKKHCRISYHKARKVLINLTAIGVIRIIHSENSAHYLLSEEYDG